jgi:hypothetical protein
MGCRNLPRWIPALALARLGYGLRQSRRGWTSRAAAGSLVACHAEAIREVLLTVAGGLVRSTSWKARAATHFPTGRLGSLEGKGVARAVPDEFSHRVRRRWSGSRAARRCFGAERPRSWSGCLRRRRPPGQIGSRLPRCWSGSRIQCLPSSRAKPRDLLRSRWSPRSLDTLGMTEHSQRLEDGC